MSFYDIALRENFDRKLVTLAQKFEILTADLDEKKVNSING